jgi:O-antigen/teichoic acid export membrane protein
MAEQLAVCPSSPFLRLSAYNTHIMIAHSDSDTLAASPPTRTQAVRGAFWSALGAVGRYALAGITTLILTHLLEPRDFGLVAITYAVQALIVIIIPTGFLDALIQHPRLDDAGLNAAFWSIVALCIAAFLFVIFLAPLAADWFAQPMLAALLVGMALVSIFRALDTVPRALLNRRLDFRTQTLARLSGMVIASLSAIILAASGGGAWALIVQAAALNVAALLVIWRAAHWRPASPRTITRSSLRALWVFALNVSLFAAVGYVILNADDQLIGYRLGSQALGFYALAYSFMAWPTRDVLGSVSAVLYPIFARFQDDPTRFRAAYLESLQLSAAFAFPTLALIGITAPVLIPWLLGPRWTPMVLTTQILVIGGLRTSTIMLNGLIFRALGRPAIHTLFQLCSLGPYLVAIWIGLRSGIEGVAFFYVLLGFLLHPVSLWLVLRTARISVYARLRALLPPAAAAGLMSAAAIPVLHAARGYFSPFLALALTGLASALVYGGVLLIWSPPGLHRAFSSTWSVLRSLFP